MIHAKTLAHSRYSVGTSWARDQDPGQKETGFLDSGSSGEVGAASLRPDCMQGGSTYVQSIGYIFF